MLVKKVSGQEPDKQHGSVENLWAAATWNPRNRHFTARIKTCDHCLGKMNEKQSKPAQILRASFFARNLGSAMMRTLMTGVPEIYTGKPDPDPSSPRKSVTRFLTLRN